MGIELPLVMQCWLNVKHWMSRIRKTISKEVFMWVVRADFDSHSPSKGAIVLPSLHTASTCLPTLEMQCLSLQLISSHRIIMVLMHSYSLKPPPPPIGEIVVYFKQSLNSGNQRYTDITCLSPKRYGGLVAVATHTGHTPSFSNNNLVLLTTFATIF